MAAVLAALPGAPLRPNQLVKALGVNRAVASKVLAATSRDDPLEVMHEIPGPEPLRRVLRASRGKGPSDEALAAAAAAIDAFDALIRSEAGTRGAFDAMITSRLPGAREQLELASKYSVFKGMSQLRGVLADHWLGVAVVSPSSTDPLKHDLTFVNGAAAIQRLRPGVDVRFAYRHDRGPAPTPDELPPSPGILALDEFCTNPPARFEARRSGDVIHYTLPDDILGRRDAVDVFIVDHHEAAMSRYAKDASLRHATSLFVEPAVPVGTLVFDVLLHDEAFPGADPQLLIYDTGYDGIANVNDPERDADRIDVRETVEYLGRDLTRLEADEFPRYGAMLRHLADRFDWDPARFRGFRTRVRYPVYGWQVCLAFDPPPAP